MDNKPWEGMKVFVASKVRKIAETTGTINITWKYCPSDVNLAYIGSRGAIIAKMEGGKWFVGPEWLLDKEKWPLHTKETDEESKATRERKLDEWDALLERSTYWCTMRVTAWPLRFTSNCKARRTRLKKTSGPLVTEEITTAGNYWVKRVQKAEEACLQSVGWHLVTDEHTGVIHKTIWSTVNKCFARI